MIRPSEEVLEIGQMLLDTKERLPHGQWTEWLAGQLDMLRLSEKTAQDYMQITRRLSDKANVIDHISARALRKLVSNRTSDLVIKIVAHRIKNGQEVTEKDIEALRLAEAELQHEMLLFVYDGRDVIQRSRDYLDDPGNDESSLGGFVYVLRGGNGQYRIGQTRNLTERLVDHRRHKPISPVCYVIMVDDPEQEEARLHSLFRSKGLVDDWFSLSDDDIAQILAIYE